MAELADQGDCPLGLLVTGHPDRDRSGLHVGRWVQGHVLDVDSRFAEGKGQLGDGPRPVGNDNPDLPQGRGGETGLEQEATIAAGGGCLLYTSPSPRDRS